jgi:hypothetical protein
MDKENRLIIFESKKIRRVWHEDEWYYSLVDVVGALTESNNATDYLKKIRKRDEELRGYIGTNCPHVEMLTETGKKRKTLAGKTENIFRLIQSIPSKKAEPFKRWLSKVGSERIEEIEDPELAFDRAMETYLAKGYSKEWINQRLKSIEVRKELTDEWEERGMKKGLEYAILTNELTKAWAGKDVKEYKQHKGLKKENLRDNMSNLELVLNMLAEASTTEISKKKQPQGMNENKDIARKGGNAAKQARLEIEKQTGEAIVSPSNAKSLLGKVKVQK